MAKILSGKEVAAALKDKLTEEVKNKSIKLIIWDPSIGNNIQILQDIVKVGEVYDEEKR